jgi:hypothetical protein
LGKTDDTKSKKNIKELLWCNSEEEYKDKKTVLTSKWSKPIVSYFQKMEKDILKHCGKWVIDKYKYTTQENHTGLHPIITSQFGRFLSIPFTNPVSRSVTNGTHFLFNLGKTDDTKSKNLACTFSFFLPCIRKATGL